MIDHRAEELWEAALGDLQLNVTRPSYETWLKDTVGVSLYDGSLIVGTPSTFASEMLGQRMYSLISQAVEKVTGEEVQVRFQVLQPGVKPNSLNGHQSEGLPISPAPVASTSPKQKAVRFNGKYTFQNFVVGSSNALAHAAAAAVADNPGKAYNPLFIYADVGLGKTHLLHSIGHQVHKQGHSLIYVSTEQFTNEYIQAIRERTTEDFRQKYRTVDVLLLDDIQFIMGKEQTQEGFFHTFNTLHMDNKQIVITCDRPARSLTFLEERIRSRLEGGLVVDIHTPGLETRLAILEAKAKMQGIEIERDVLLFLGEISPRNIRELEGNLNRAIAYAQLTQSAITMELAKRALADVLSQQSSPLICEQGIIDTVAAYFGTDPNELLGRKRDKGTAMARQVTMYLLRQELKMPLATVGKLMGGKDHSTVIHACNRVSSLLNSDADFRKNLLSIRNLLLEESGNRR